MFPRRDALIHESQAAADGVSNWIPRIELTSPTPSTTLSVAPSITYSNGKEKKAKKRVGIRDVSKKPQYMCGRKRKRKFGCIRYEACSCGRIFLV